MTQKPDGGPAYPNPALADEAYHPSRDETGMSLRDYFAGQVLASLADHYNGKAFDPIGYSRIAYEYADAMIAARGQDT